MPNATPWDFGQSREAAARAARLQAEAEEVYRTASAELAAKERTYRVALAQEIMRLHSDGVAWTTAEELARGTAHIADLRYERDLAKGVLKAAESATWRQSANRKDCLEFITWSRCVAPDGQWTQRPVSMDRAA